MLIVDDRVENLVALEELLIPLGYRIVRAMSADDALRHLLHEDFAVVLLDVRMPGVDGVETARLIKARQKSRVTPIIFITALDANRRQVSEAYASGAVDYLFKPIDPTTLRAKVSAFADLYEKREHHAWQERRRYADAAVRQSDERFRLVAKATNDVLWEWDLQSGALLWNDLVRSVFKLDANDGSADHAWRLSRIHPEDRARVADGLRRAIESDAEGWADEYRFQRGDGSWAFVFDRGYVARDEAGRALRMIGAAQDISERVRARADADAARAAAEDARRQVTAILESISDPFVVYDAEWRFRYINAAAADNFRRIGAGETAALIGRTLWEVFPIVNDSIHERNFRDVQRTRRARVFESQASNGSWQEIHAYPTADGGLAVTWKDITARKRAEEALRFLSEASAILASSLDYETTLRTMAELVVPRMADWCGIEIVGDDGVSRQLVAFHTDAAQVALAHRLRELYPADPDAPAGLPNVLRTGATEFYPDVTDDQLVAAARDAEHLRIVRALHLHSVIIVALVARDRVLGALTLIGAESGRRFTQDDVALAESLARRAALAVDNARLFRDAERARAEAEAANRTKSEFLATMSHELRTPLNAIAGYAELLEMELRGPVTGEQREDLRRIQRSQRHLLALVNDVLNFAKLDTGHLHYDLHDVRLADALASVEAFIAPQFAAKGLTYLYCEPDPTLVVRADVEKLGQIVVNLLTNALKFTEAGGTVTLECGRSGERVAISVRDTGRGIPADKLDAIFEPFVQVDRGLTRSTEGTGLGLAISRGLARAMGGDLAVTSTPGVGSVFTLALPAASSA